MTMFLYKLIYKVGIWIRNPSIPSSLNFLLASDHWSYSQLQNYQFSKLKELLQFAYDYSEYYKAKFNEIGFQPSKMSHLDDLIKIPIIDKTTLLKFNDAIHTNYKFKKKFYSETSGTSGQVLKFFRNEEWESQHRAAMFRGYNWYNVKPWDRNGYFWGYNVEKKKVIKTKILDSLQNRFRLFSYDEKEIKSFCKKLQKAHFLSGYSSMIYETAKIINSSRIQSNYSFKLKMVKGTSEKIFDNYHSEVIKAFGLKIISEYGSTESGIIAFECPEGSHMHIAMENVIVEEIDGEIIVTNLLSRSFPIIRYKLGDSIKLAEKAFKCSCGREHAVIIDVLGRVGKNVIGMTTKFPSLTFYYVFKNLALDFGIFLNYQAIQTKKGKVLIKVEQNSPEFRRNIENELEKYFNNDIEFEIKFDQSLHAFDGKLRDFIPIDDEIVSSSV